MDPQNQPQFNPKIPISEVLKQEKAGFVPSAPKQDTPPPAPINSAPTSAPKMIIKTYRGDAAEAAKAQQMSVAKIAIEEERRRREQEINKTPKKNIGLLLIIIILVAIGAAAIPTVQYIINQKNATVPIVLDKTIIPFDHQENIIMNNATRDEFISAINTLNAKPPSVSTIEYREVFEKIQDNNQNIINQKITPDIFAEIIGPNMPSALARSFDSDYMYGTENATDTETFIIFKTSSYEQTFANMLKWEKEMIPDLTPILNLGVNTSGLPFTDQVIINKDVRAVVAPNGTILFLYGFLDNQTLIITTSSQTFQDINSRYVASKFVQ